jgi:hypothetical protein
MLMEPSGTLWLLSALLLIGWSVWAWFHPLAAFGCLVWVWITVYARASLPLFQVEGLGNRGGLALGDLLWLAFIGLWLARALLSEKIPLKLPKWYIDPLLLGLLPYLGLSVLLPLLGVLGGWSPSFAIPGLRHLQWVSFAWIGYALCRQYGMLPLGRSTLIIFTLSGILHAAHALIQLLVPLGVLPSDWLVLDQTFASRFAVTWFFYPRTTGLLVNPNSYGLFGMVLLLIWGACLLARVRLGRGLSAFLVLSGLWAMLTSASRTAIVGLTAGAFLLWAAVLLKGVATRDRKDVAQAVGLLLKVVSVLIAGFTLTALLLPPHLFQRLAMLTEIITAGAEVDPNAVGRFDLWASALQAYEERYVAGTWVPAGYALASPIDSYYVTLLVQGTAIYLMAFLVWLFVLLMRGWQMTQATVPVVAAIGLATIGLNASVAATSLTLSPLLEPQVLTPFWLLTGFGLAFRKCEKSCS